MLLVEFYNILALLHAICIGKIGVDGCLYWSCQVMLYALIWKQQKAPCMKTLATMNAETCDCKESEVQDVTSDSDLTHAPACQLASAVCMYAWGISLCQMSWALLWSRYRGDPGRSTSQPNCAESIKMLERVTNLSSNYLRQGFISIGMGDLQRWCSQLLRPGSANLILLHKPNCKTCCKQNSLRQNSGSTACTACRDLKRCDYASSNVLRAAIWRCSTADTIRWQNAL